MPASPVLRAAARWLEHRGESSDTQIRALFTSHPAFGDITPTQYAAAYVWLQNSGLLGAGVPARECRRVVFEAALQEALWFADSDVLVPDKDALPEDGVCAAEALNIPPDEAFAQLRAFWGKVDTAERSRVGIAGERALTALLKAVETLHVQHVALDSDGYGYDVGLEADAPQMVLHLEVKSTTRRGRLRIFLSRNEFETMQRDKNWLLVAVRLNEDLDLVAVATINRGWLAASAPSDRPGGSWESVKLDVPPSALSSGIAPLTEQGHGCGLPILQGAPRWPG